MPNHVPAAAPGLPALTRRRLLLAAPAIALPCSISAADAGASDPLVPLYQDWLTARRDWWAATRLPGNDDWQFPESIEAEQREDRAFWQMIEMTPTSAAGIAALAAVLWTLTGPTFRPDLPEHAEELEFPKHRVLVAIWRAASGDHGLPRTGVPDGAA